MTVLVVVAHPDDEVLGCGGTIARHRAEGDEVHVLFMTDGVGARGAGEREDQSVEVRIAAAGKAANVLGIASLEQESFPDNGLDSVPRLEVIQAVERHVAKIRPRVIYTHHAGDLNVDHRRVHEAVMTACRPQPGAGVKAIYSMEILSSTGWSSPSMGGGFVPQRFVDISEWMGTKEEALKAYEIEMRPAPHARSLDALVALARYRGSLVGVDYAEAFAVEREVV